MLIGIDCRLWRQTGVGRYTQNLVKNLFKIDKDNKYVLFVLSEDFETVNKEFASTNWQVVKADVRWHSIAEQTKFSFFLNSFKLDLIHFPYFSVPYLYRRKFIVTVHDLIINKFNTGQASTLPYPVYLSKRLAYSVVLKNALNRSKKIITPSLAVRNDLLDVYKNLNPEKIEVTYEGGFSKEYASANSSLGEYILRVGNFYPHKNVGNFLIAFSKLKNKNIKLVLVGKKDFFYKKIESQIKNLNLESKVIFFDNPSDEKLYALYKHARLVAVPSLMEGFSLTAVEAMSVGVPVALSDIAVHREICKDSAIYFDPNNALDMTEKIDNFLDLDSIGLKKIKDLENSLVMDYSWEKMAKQTLSIYNSTSK